jgi:pilus assembly protein CpaB
MNRRLVSILLTAFLIAAVCAFLVNRVISNKAAAGLRPVTIRVVAAAADIKLGTLLTDKNLTTIEIAGTVPKGTILTADKAIGRGVISNLYEVNRSWIAAWLRLAPAGVWRQPFVRA